MAIIEKTKTEFTQIYSDYYQVVYGTIYSKTGSLNDTDDLTQEVFILLYSRMNEVENVRSWLFAVINNVLMNYYRKKKKFESVEDINSYLSDISLTFVNGFRDTRMIIDEAIEGLSESDRLIFDLIAVQNHTYDRTGRHLGLTVRQVKYRYSIIMKEIRNFLNSKGIKNIEDLL